MTFKFGMIFYLMRKNIFKYRFDVKYGCSLLKTYIIHGPDFDSVDYDVRTIMLNTNRLGPPSSDQMTNIPKVDDLINKLDTGQFLPDQVTFVFI